MTLPLHSPHPRRRRNATLIAAPPMFPDGPRFTGLRPRVGLTTTSEAQQFPFGIAPRFCASEGVASSVGDRNREEIYRFYPRAAEWRRVRVFRFAIPYGGQGTSNPATLESGAGRGDAPQAARPRTLHRDWEAPMVSGKAQCGP